MPLYLGLMSGTSMDATDCALVHITEGVVQLLGYRETPYAESLRARLDAARRQGNRLTVSEYAAVDVDVARAFAASALDLLAAHKVKADQIRAIGSHGQTLLHQPRAQPPYTVQAGDPNILAALTGITTVADFRRRDLAIGGQGAPLAPALHAALFRSADQDRCVANLGGIANVTLLPRDATQPVSGYDTGPGNALLDEWASRHLGAAMDTDGEWAASGRLVESLLDDLLADPYFSLPPPKSTGRDYFHLPWLEDRLRRHPNLRPADVQATLLALTACALAGAVLKSLPGTRELLICGGGAMNPPLMRAIEGALPGVKVMSTAACGYDPRCIEAMLCAWLAHRRLEGLPGNLPSVTGARADAVLGGVYYGRDKSSH
ncbi:MAG TPA: anhydro-N-acetylmuramic acid kinase [Gammaproteobacteria bacterium]|nr:anhydro-N-acetylmuramic acid kinase [Gammaproteobacteria bacterium]